MKVSSVEETRRLDERAMGEFCVPDRLLMENAGQAVYYAILSRLGVRGRRFAVLAGPGNNGGDAFVAARKLYSTGAGVRVLVLADPAAYTGAARLNHEMLVRSGAQILVDPPLEDVGKTLHWCDAVVDGLLGTGITRDVTGRLREVIEEVNGSGRPVVAIDIPSGVDGNTGHVRGAAIRAQTTVTFGLPKRGNLLYPGAELGGNLIVSHISFPPRLTSAPEIVVAVSEPSAFPDSSDEAHGDPGEVLVVAGTREATGAAEITAAALLGAGGGRCRLAVPRSAAPRTGDLPSGVVVVHQAETAAGGLAPDALEEIMGLHRSAASVVLGPLLSADRETRDVVRSLVSHIPQPLVINGDGALTVAVGREVLSRRTEPVVLLLSPDELTDLVGSAVARSGADPIRAVQDAAESLHAILVLEGRNTLVGLPDRRVFIDPRRTPGAAYAGSRDVLAGTIAAMHGRGLPLEEAVPSGVFLRGIAGELAVGIKGHDGIHGRDIVARLPEATRRWREGLAGDSCSTIEVI